jgi:hypothetical protein
MSWQAYLAICDLDSQSASACDTIHCCVWDIALCFRSAINVDLVAYLTLQELFVLKLTDLVFDWNWSPTPIQWLRRCDIHGPSCTRTISPKNYISLGLYLISSQKVADHRQVFCHQIA